MIKSEYKNIFENEESHFVYVSMHRTIVKLLNKYLYKKRNPKKLKLLDAGCGTGGLLNILKKDYETYGIDFSPIGIKLAKKRGLKNLRVGSVMKLPYKSNIFDVVVCIDVLYHQEVDEDVDALNEFRRVLKPNGILIIKVPAYNWLRGNHDSIAKTKHRFSRNEVINKIKKVKLKNIKTTYSNMFLFPLVLAKRLVDHLSNTKAHSDVTKVDYRLNNFLIFLSTIEDKLIEHLDLPFGLTIFGVASKPNTGKGKKIQKS